MAEPQSPETTFDESTPPPHEPVDAVEIASPHWPGPDSPPSGKAGRNLLFTEIARGGMGAVLHGRDPDLGRDLAVKVLLEAHRDKPELVRRFLEEAQIGGQLQHPGVVPVYELGRFDDYRPFFTMKLVKGQTLAELLKRRRTTADDLPRLLTIFEQVCQTVAYAHVRGVIHRDLKPANVMVGSFGEVQVMDWGVAKVLSRDGAERKPAPEAGPTVIHTPRSGSTADGSQAGTVLGTPAFMPPEQANGETDHLDRRADVFGLGAILCTILTVAPPYRGPDANEVHRKAMRGDVTDAFARLDGCGADAQLVQLAKYCLCPEAGGRPPDAGVVAARVAAYQAGVQERLRRAELDRAAALVKAAEERKRRKLAVALAASVLALAVVGGGAAWGLVQWRAGTDARIQLALQEAGALRAQAQATPVGEQAVARWDAAEGAGRRLEDLVAQGFPSPELRQRVQDFNAALADEAAAGRWQAKEIARDRQFVGQLADVRTSKEDEFDMTDTEAAYRAAFAGYGLDVDALTTEEAAGRLFSRPAEVTIEVAAALDDWALERRRLKQPVAAWQRLLALARAVDRDPWRTGLRSLDYTAIGKEQQKVLDLAETAKVAQLPPASAQLLAMALREAGETGRAEAVLREAQRLHPGDLWLNYELAELLKEHPFLNADEVIRYYTAARAVRPEIGHALGHALEKAGRKDEALAVFAELTRLRPNNPRHHNCLGLTLHDKKELDEAIKEFRAAIALDPKRRAPHHNLGLALYDKKELDEAIKEFRAAIALDPTFAAPHNGLGNALHDKKELDEAIKEYRAAIALDPKDGKAHHNLGIALRDKKKLEEAIHQYRAAIGLDAKLAAPHIGLGDALANKKELDEAIKEYRAAIALDPKDGKGHGALGEVLLEVGRFAEARESTHRCLELLQPNDPLRQFGTLQLQQCEQLLALDQKLAAVLDGLDKPADDVERVNLAWLCQQPYKHRYAAAAHLYAEVLDGKPDLAKNPPNGVRYNAALAAALASCGKGEDAAKLDDKERARLRRQALDWLKADLALWAKQADGTNAKARDLVQQKMKHWQEDTDLAGVRDKDGLNKLPDDEAKEWRKLWDDVTAVLAKAGGGK